MTDDTAPDHAGSDRSLISRHRREIVSAVLLAAASVATALSLYQATRWNGAMLIAFNDSARTGAEARELAVERAADVAAWSAFREAEESGDVVLSLFFKDEIFSAQLQESWAEWDTAYVLASEAVEPGRQSPFRYEDLGALDRESYLVAVSGATGLPVREVRQLSAEEISEVLPPSPLEHPSYLRSESAEEAERVASTADARFQSARDANWNSDRYVLNTVLFSMTLFFAGIATKFTSRRLQIALLGLSSTFLVTGVALFVYLPFY